MRHLILGIGLLVHALPAQATIIEFAPDFFIAPSEGSSSFTIENLTIVAQSTNTSANGSGNALATITGFDRADIRAALGDGPGDASASLTNHATFDLIFDEPGDIGLVFGFGINGPVSTDPGDISFANWSISILVDGVFVGEDQDHRCDNTFGTDSGSNSCGNFFDFSFGEFPFTVGDDLRLPVSTSMRFDIGVSRAAVAIPEPGALAMLLLSLAWIGRKTVAVSRV